MLNRIPGPSGYIIGNEKADELTKAGSVLPEEESQLIEVKVECVEHLAGECEELAMLRRRCFLLYFIENDDLRNLGLNELLIFFKTINIV